MAAKRIFQIMTLIMAFASLGDARKLLFVCSALDASCAAGCYVSGYNYYKYTCESGSCGCTNNALAACFPGSSLVTTPAGHKQMNQLALGDSVLTVSNSGALEFNKASTL